MHIDHETKKRSRAPFILSLLLTIGIAAYSMLQLQDAELIYADVEKEQSKPIYSGQLKTVQIEGSEKKLNIPTYSLFSAGNTWSLVSKAHPLKSDYVPNNLVSVTLPHGDATSDMKIQSKIQNPLTAMFAAASSDGHDLMISSAYRSIGDQKALYNDFVAAKGEEMAKEYVANPGTSEHHTGLAVDLSDVSRSCGIDSDQCSLGFSSADWLADNAYKFGFIQRYPEGKQPITGISFEPWHYRYVGVDLARAMHNSDLTLDEVLTQLYPAFGKMQDQQ